MLNFFKNHGALILMLLMFPVLWPVYAVYNLAHLTQVSYDDCREVWFMWIVGTALYCALLFCICGVLYIIFQVALILYSDGYLVYALIGLGVVVMSFIAPRIIYCIFKIIKK